MRAIRCRVTVLSTVLATLLGCGGGGGSQPVPTGTLTVRFGSDSFPGFQQVVLSMAKLEASTDGSHWTTLTTSPTTSNPDGAVQATVDLMAIQGGASQVLTTSTLGAGTYEQFRVTWGRVNYASAIQQPAYVVPTGGYGQLLSVPATTTFLGTVTVASGGNATVQLMVNGNQAVLTTPVYPYIFNATGTASDLGASGFITGKLTGWTTAMQGTEVYAETVTGVGLASIQRRALVGPQGTFTLEGLPMGNSYFVVTQPTAGTTACPAVAMGPVTAAQVMAQAMVPLVVGTAVPAGTVELAITPPSSSSQGTWGELRQGVATGAGGTQNLIVRSQTATTVATQDQVLFQGVTPGFYGLTAQRSTSGGAPNINVGTTSTLTAGANPPVALTYP